MDRSRPVVAARIAGRLWWLPFVPLGVLADRGSRARWLLTPGVVTATALVSSVAKLVVRRPRPGASHRRAPWGRLDAAGFPSTHSACAFAIAAWLRTSRHGPRLHLLAVLIGCSRVGRRAHRPTDVVAGAILGYGLVHRVERAWPKPSRLPSRSPDPPAVEPVPRSRSRRGRDHTAHRAGHQTTLRAG